MPKFNNSQLQFQAKLTISFTILDIQNIELWFLNDKNGCIIMNPENEFDLQHIIQLDKLLSYLCYLFNIQGCPAHEDRQLSQLLLALRLKLVLVSFL